MSVSVFAMEAGDRHCEKQTSYATKANAGENERLKLLPTENVNIPLEDIEEMEELVGIKDYDGGCDVILRLSEELMEEIEKKTVIFRTLMKVSGK